MRKIAVFCEGRQTYDLKYWTLKKLESSEDFELHLILAGSHFLNSQGNTYRQIEKDEFKNIYKINNLEGFSTQSKGDLARSTARIIVELTDIFEKVKPDLLLLLGDRYELLAAAEVSTIMGVPIAHICGGEQTEGAIDEQIRHAITKLSHLHFTGCEKYRQNVIRLGEKKEFVFNVGEPGLENIKKVKELSKEELFRQLNISSCVGDSFFLITYHPTTLREEDLVKEIDSFISSLNYFPEVIKIITAPNADFGGGLYYQRFKEFTKRDKKTFLFSTLGSVKYLNAMRFADAVIGNSSSGIIETPSFCVPTVNVGDRQRGRIRSKNIIDCDLDNIVDAIKKAKSSEFRKSLIGMSSPFGDGETSNKILEMLRNIKNYKILLQKELVWEK